GVPLHIVDTAGLRETDDTVESIGIARTWAEIEKANVIIHLKDARDPAGELDEVIKQRLPGRTPVLEVHNKIDLLVAPDVARDIGSPDKSEFAVSVLGISAKTGAGL